MTETISIIPTLHEDIQHISSPVDIIKYVLRAYVSNPKGINDTFAQQEISFIYDLAYETTVDALELRVSKNLHDVLRRHFPTAGLDIDITTEAKDAKFFDIAFDITVTIDGKPYSVIDSYTKDNDGNLKFEFQG